ncbi:MAG TPA: Mrp/NBP35 family ATP-binding protein, partial [Acidimicrobiales bacterium]|nr:Mrp/NBP35 family ATP-binding protein [Acidimicrobiales bacterium]
MPPSEAQLLEALRAVRDPELGRSLVDLELIREARTRWGGKAAITVARASPAHPRQAELVSGVEDALRDLPGVRTVEVTLVDLDEHEARALGERLRATAGAAGAEGGSPAGAGGERLGHEEGRPNPFMARGSRTRVLGISSGKGGVGKSSVSVNLAVALARSGLDVAILDADVYGFSIPRMLGVDQSPMVVGEVIVPPVVHGVRCLSAGFFVGDDTPVIWRGPMLHKALEQFLVDVHWGDPDVLVIDMPPGTGDVALSLSQYLPRSEVFVVTTPQPAAQRVAQRSAYMAKKLKLPVRGVIENMSWFTGDDGRRYELFGAGGGQALAEALDVPLVGQVPLMPALRIGGDEGLPVTVSDPTGEAARAFGAVAERVQEMGPARV